MRRRLLLITAASLSLTAAAVAPAAANAATSCRPPTVTAPAGAVVESVRATADAGGTVTVPDQTPLPTPPPIADVPAWCDITVVLAHPGAADHVTVKVSLPSDPARWNGRLQAVGGSAYLAGNLDGAELVTAVKSGYAATATDAGVGDNPLDTTWAIQPGGSLNDGLLTNFASRSVHEMAVVAKDVTRAFYGRAANRAYFNGCSTGGRQGYQEAQSWPDDFDGILAAAPAINWDRFAVATLWPQVVFHEERVAPTACELKAFNAAATAACDTSDGVRDGIIDDPRTCSWDPRALAGTTVRCDGVTRTITRAEAEAVRRIWQGPPSWYGPNRGADVTTFLAVPGQPFFVADLWAKYFVTRDAAFDTTRLTVKDFTRLYAASRRQFHRVIGSDDPDLRAFRDSGGKLLSWHGQYDELVPTEGTVDYRRRVERLFGGGERVDGFYRLFLLPGVAHCGGGPGGQPVDPLGALVDWVERGHAPAALATVSAGGVTRNVARYPMR
ncbi:tannase [Actinoplanes philippinensis]|uniref:Tannase and feruloyl esterase n=1 Tax=Actinoplanes philippinensis TaxID=35752 RepID=A0A1I2EB53_9ACTN|nr:tannase/feruloyl esterase family alpha/beta hydrolase [Actinoplanes philippinensis]GIE77126.1 tannase [Actinoplanes philippinensis]SFE90075.1 Tannase and feruloyl esterase [Actinoplanes philippinensis]